MVGVAPGGGVVRRPRPPRPPSWPGVKGGFGALDGCSVMFRPPPSLWNRRCDGHSDDKGPLFPENQLPAACPSNASGPVGGSVSINKPYVTFIAFSLGFRGDGVGEGSPGILFS